MTPIQPSYSQFIRNLFNKANLKIFQVNHHHLVIIIVNMFKREVVVSALYVSLSSVLCTRGSYKLNILQNAQERKPQKNNKAKRTIVDKQFCLLFK